MRISESIRNFFTIAMILSAIAILLVSLYLRNKDKKPDVVVTEQEIKSMVDPVSEWHCVPIAPMKITSAVGQKNKFWTPGQTVRVGFPWGGPESYKTLIKNGFSSWAQSANLKFTYPAVGPYDIRVSFNQGSAWSYIGTDSKIVTAQYPTLNFGFGFGQVEQSAGRSVVAEHEIGHALGLLHEQQLAGGVCYNESNVIKDLSGPPNNWSLATIRFNVLDYHDAANVITSGYDQESVMHYSIPASWTCEGKSIKGGTGITVKDREFVAARYPGAIVPPSPSTVTISKVKRDEVANLLNLAKTYQDSARNVFRKATGL